MEGHSDLGPAGGGRPDRLCGQTRNHAVTGLPQIADLTQASALRGSLMSWLTEPAMVFGAGSVQRISTPCVQVLIAAGCAASSETVSFVNVNGLPVIRAALADPGLQPAFAKRVV